ncbi:hypothetical protein [Sphingomonas psychrotolerans]|uniref:hypothetical protein n=1 Tax=Sphingomonas psychrotolerans TaxID=1327635 RepID=UPI0013052EF2|nr:hypothetical protein [Sphingomonas psychrotolerans]
MSGIERYPHRRGAEPKHRVATLGAYRDVERRLRLSAEHEYRGGECRQQHCISRQLSALVPGHA